MLHVLAHWFFSAFAFIITAYLVPGFQVRSLTSALIAAALLGVVNALVWPLLVVLTLPITILTLGLFLLVVNAICIMMVSALTPGFSVKNIGWGIIGAAVLSVVGAVLQWLAVAL